MDSEDPAVVTFNCQLGTDSYPRRESQLRDYPAQIGLWECL